MAQTHLDFSVGSPGTKSQLFKAASRRKQEIMGQQTVAEQRQAQQRLYEARPLSPGLEVLPVECAGVPCEWVWRPEGHSEKVILYFHGGGWITGNCVISRPTACLLAERTNFKVLSVEYRLAPEHPFPAGLTDCRLVYGWLLGQGYRPENIALFGDSAGGNLCFSLLHLLLDEGADLPCAVACASPVTDITDTAELIRDPLPSAFAMVEGIRRTIFDLYAGGQDRSQPLLSPVYGDLSAFPPVLIHVGGDEPLAVDNAAFAKRAVAQGVDALCKIWREMFHDFSIVGLTLKESRQSLTELTQFYQKHLGRGANPRRPL